MTVPPVWMVSVPVPGPPTERSALFVQVEPAPVTATVPLEPLTLPIKPLVSVTVPPFWTVSVPVPASATTRTPLFAQVEPGSVTVTVPLETLKPAIKPVTSDTLPPFWTVSVPVPKSPTKSSWPLFVQVEPGPVTVTVPLEPLRAAIKPLRSVTVPPFWTVSAPVVLLPTIKSALGEFPKGGGTVSDVPSIMNCACAGPAPNMPRASIAASTWTECIGV